MNSTNSHRPPLIVLEGIDGSGTTTQAERLSVRLTRQGRQVHATREPTAGPVGRFLRQALQNRLLDPDGRPVSLDWASMALLFAADRVDHDRREIAPALGAGKVVISDRYDLSSLLYQSFTSPLGAEALPWLATINGQVRRPDLTIVLVLPDEVAAERRRMRGGEPEIYEQTQLQRQLSEGYRNARAILPGDRIELVDAAQAIDVVETQICEIIADFID